MPRLSGSRPKQTRLAFTPLPSSSPAAKGYNKQIQDRAAAVSLAGARKRRKVEHDLEWHNDLGNAQIDGVNDSFPIPATSLTTQANKDIRSESGSDSEPVRTTQRHPDAGNTSTSTTRRSSRQQPLDFFSGRDAGSFSPPIKLSSSLKSHSPKRAGMFSSSRTRPVVDVSSDSESLDSPNKLLSRHKTRAPRSQNSRKVKTVSSKPQAITVDSDSDGEGIVVSSPPVSKEPRQQDGPADDDEEVDEDDDMPTTLGTQRRKRLKRPSPDTFIASSPPAFDGGDDDAELVASTRKRRRQHDGDTSAEEHDQPVTPSRRKKGRSKQLSRREREELEEDKAFLEPSSDIEALERQPRSTQSTQKSAKQKALEKLKRKRSGQVTASEDEQEHDMTGDASARANHDDDSDGIELVRQPASSRQMFDEDEYDKDFLDSDAEEENALGVPDGLSLQFTRYASMKASELFIYVVEWYVTLAHNIIKKKRQLLTFACTTGPCKRRSIRPSMPTTRSTSLRRRSWTTRLQGWPARNSSLRRGLRDSLWRSMLGQKCPTTRSTAQTRNMPCETIVMPVTGARTLRHIGFNLQALHITAKRLKKLLQTTTTTTMRRRATTTTITMTQSTMDATPRTSLPTMHKVVRSLLPASSGSSANSA